jgi:hypothetical protein
MPPLPPPTRPLKSGSSRRWRMLWSRPWAVPQRSDEAFSASLKKTLSWRRVRRSLKGLKSWGVWSVFRS